MDIAKFHAEYDVHADDRIRLFEAVAGFVDPGRVLYPGSYVDVAPSVFFDDVQYVDMDKRAARWFSEHEDVESLIRSKREKAGGAASAFAFDFAHTDYREPLGLEGETVDLMISLYAGFISEHCTRYLKSGGYLLANNSHGDASMASLDGDYELAAVVTSRGGTYTVVSHQLEAYFVPKRGEPPTVESLHISGRGVAFKKPAFAYLFKKL